MTPLLVQVSEPKNAICPALFKAGIPKLKKVPLPLGVGLPSRAICSVLFTPVLKKIPWSSLKPPSVPMSLEKNATWPELFREGLAKLEKVPLPSGAFSPSRTICVAASDPWSRKIPLSSVILQRFLRLRHWSSRKMQLHLFRSRLENLV